MMTRTFRQSDIQDNQLDAKLQQDMHQKSFLQRGRPRIGPGRIMHWH